MPTPIFEKVVRQKRDGKVRYDYIIYWFGALVKVGGEAWREGLFAVQIFEIHEIRRTSVKILGYRGRN